MTTTMLTPRPAGGAAPSTKYESSGPIFRAPSDGAGARAVPASAPFLGSPTVPVIGGGPGEDEDGDGFAEPGGQPRSNAEKKYLSGSLVRSLVAATCRYPMTQEARRYS